MTRRRILLSSALAASLIGFVVAEASAQPFGTLRWRTDPYCNVLTLSITQNGGGFTLSGFDEPCGGRPRLPVHGVAIIQPDGSITLGLSVINVPGGAPVNLEASIDLATVSGTWRDSAGQSGALTLNPAGPGGSSPRPLQPSAGPAGPAGTATAWATVNGFDLAFNAQSANVVGVTRAPGYTSAGGWCITFSEPIPLERRGAAVVGAVAGATVILGNATSNFPDMCPGGLFIFATGISGGGFNTYFNFIVP